MVVERGVLRAGIDVASVPEAVHLRPHARLGGEAPPVAVYGRGHHQLVLPVIVQVSDDRAEWG